MLMAGGVKVWVVRGHWKGILSMIEWQKAGRGSTSITFLEEFRDSWSAQGCKKLY